MAGARISRRKIAAYYADQLLAGKKTIARELAAFLTETGRAREVELVVRDIEAALADRGVLLAEVASSRTLSDDAVKEVQACLKKTTNATEIHLRKTVDPTLLGGVRIATPGRELDGTVRHRLNQLRASKI
jgi:F-type H+-transporting ATPase subunit delta